MEAGANSETSGNSARSGGGDNTNGGAGKQNNMNGAQTGPSVVVPSLESMTETLRIRSLTEQQLVEEYLNHPMVPYDESITIDKIGILNFDCLKKEPLGMIQYKTFRDLCPEKFPVCKDPKLDYEDTEQVSPAVIISGTTKYQTPQTLWFPLSDIIVNIMFKQGLTGRKLLPITVVIDRADQWMVPLFNLAMDVDRSSKKKVGNRYFVTKNTNK